MSQSYISLIKKLKSYRVSMSKTQDEVAFQSNLSLRTVINIESGKNVSMENFVKYIDCLGLTQSFVNFPPIVDMRFEDIPQGKYERTRAYKRRKAPKWGNDK